MPIKVNTLPDAPWKQRYRSPSIWSASIAALAPERGLISSTLTGTVQYHAWDVRSGRLRQLTNTPGGQASHLSLSPDGRWAYYLKDQGGSEVGHYVRLPYEGGEAEDITPGMPGYSSYAFSVCRAGTRLGFTTAGPEGFSVWLMDISRAADLGAPRLLCTMRTLGAGPLFSSDGTVAVVMSSEHSSGVEFCLVAYDAATGRRVAELWDGPGTSLESQRFSPATGDHRLAATTNRTGIETVLTWDPLSDRRIDLELPIPGAQGLHDWSPDGGRLVVGALHQAVQSVFVHDLAAGKTRKLGTPAGDLGLFYAPDGAALYSLWGDAGHSLRLVRLDEATGAIAATVLAPGSAPAGRPMTSVSFPSVDGSVVQGWLCVPDGRGPFPLILDTHGGPAGAQTNGFNPAAQAWVDHGYAFLSVNYHGSTTFGRNFEKSIWNRLGELEVQDMAAGREYLVKRGIAQPDAVFLTGWSYGGYLTLLALGRRPELWAGGLAGIAIADWAQSWEDSADTLRGYQEALLGGTPAQQPERYRASSPITYVQAVRAPLLIIQGRSDSRTPPRPVEAYEKRMKELGKEIRVHWFDTGHMGSFSDVELGISHQEMMMLFAQEVMEKRSVTPSGR